MREIKFRAWDKTHSKMTTDITALNWINGAPKPIYEGWDWYKTEFEIMQYTGLKDKNEKEIYEGDIVKYYDYMLKEYAICKIEWVDKFITYVANDEFDNDIFIQKIDERRLEVIGNIYENQNLLEIIDVL